jgi:hypothetical protein
VLPSGAPIDISQWPGANPKASNNEAHADTPTSTDFSQLQAFSVYTAEIFVNGSTAPIIETARIQAPIQAPGPMAKIPLHDLSPNIPLIKPTHAAAATVTAQWVRVPGAVRIESAGVLFNSGTSFVQPSVNLPDAFSLNPTSTSVVIGNGTFGFPAQGTNDYREINISGTSARSNFLHSIRYQP